MRKAYLLMILSASLFAFLKSNAQGWVWGRGATGNSMEAWAIATDQSGNIYGAGLSSGTSGSVIFGSDTVAFPSLQIVWVKYNSNGAVLWAGSTISSDPYLYNITTDRAGNLIVFGTFSDDTMQIGSFTLINPSTTSYNAQYFLAKISPTGTVLWAINDGDTIAAGAGGVATDTAGNIYVTASFGSHIMSIGTYTLTNIGGEDIFVAKYSPTGIRLWATSIGGPDYDYVNGITVTAPGNVYITGDFYSPSITVGTSIMDDPHGGGGGPTIVPYAYIAEFSGATGAPVWAQAAGGANGAYGTGITSDVSGNVYMTGYFADPSISFGSTTINQTYPGVGKNALYLVQYSPANVVAWGKTIGSPTLPVLGYSIALTCDQVWVSGLYIENADIDGNTLTLVHGLDPCFIAGYDLSGGVIGYTGLGSGGDDQNGIATDAAGNLYLCGDYADSVIIGPDTLDYNQEGEYFYLAKYAIPRPDTNYAHKDTIVCAGISEVLTAPAGYSAYYWNDGNTMQTDTIHGAGTYWVYNTICGAPMLIDTFHVALATSDTTYSHDDTSICITAIPASLTAPAGYTSYLWSTGSINSFIAVSSAGTYNVYCATGCDILIDTFYFSITPSDTTYNRDDTGICATTTAIPVSLTAPGGYTSYLWSTGSTSLSIEADSAGAYTVRCTTGCNVLIDSFNVSYFPPVVLSNVTQNQTIPYGNSVQLNADSAMYYLWTPDNGTLNNPNINDPVATPLFPTTYTVYGMNIHGCKDSATVTIDLTYGNIFIPDAFTPNGDGLNDFFRVDNLGYYKLVDMMIFNRWGELVYHDVTGENKGWDGTFNGVPQDLGVFNYLIILNDPNGNLHKFKGSITLIR